MNEQLLEKAIVDTIRYFDLFDMPLTATQVWRSLIVDPRGKSGLRWGGHRQYGLREIQTCLADSNFLQAHLGRKHGFFFLPGRAGLVAERLTRHMLSQDKWHIMCGLSPYLAAVPFVRALAASGSFALDHTKPSSDLDVFVVARAGRIWTARLVLLLMTELLGRRRKYWNVQAPDKVCLNHYVTDDHLAMPAGIANLYTAVQYTLHTPIFGVHVLHRFRQANAGWIHRYVMAPDLPHVHHRYTARPSAVLLFGKRAIEGMLLEPVGNGVERVAEKWQRAVIERHKHSVHGGRVAVSSQELAFHPDSKVPALLQTYYQEAGQQRLF